MQRLIIAIVMGFTSVYTMNAQLSTKINITIGADSFVATLYNNATAKAFIEMLPMTVSMNELNGNEKYYYMSNNLPSSPEQPLTINNGDLMLYQQNYIVIFYESFSPSYIYTKIGYIDNPTGLKTALGSGNPTVKFELIGNITRIDSNQPTNNDFRISNNGILQYSENANRISLLDINGRVLSSSTTGTVNLSSFPKGVYILRIDAQGQNKTRIIKFIF